MSNSELIGVSVIVARERIDSPWSDHVWRVAEVLDEPLALPAWTRLRQSPDADIFHAGATTLVLHRKDTSAYAENLAGEKPVLYVVLRENPDAGEAPPIELLLVAASAFEAQANAESGTEIVGRVPIPPAILARIESFVAEHHVAEPFAKRQRTAHHRAEQHQFGQEPIDALRRRMIAAGRDPGDRDGA